MKKLLFAIFIMFVSVIGCEVPYTGPLLSVRDVDRYLNSVGEDTVCLQDGFDSVCLKVVMQEKEDKSDVDVPIVHIHSTGITYVFYYEGLPILRAEKTMDTAQIAQELIDTGRTQLPPNSEQLGAGGDQGSNGDGDNVSGNWTIQIYYPESFPEADRGLTPETSGFEIRVVEGVKLLPNDRRDLEIRNFTQTEGPDGSRSLLFSVETDATEMTIRVKGLVPDYTARFHINMHGVVADDGTNTFQLQPVQ